MTLAPALGLAGDPYGVTPDLPQLPEPAMLADGLYLEAAALEPRTAAPGQSVFVTLRWHAATSPLQDLRPALTLAQENSRLLTDARRIDARPCSWSGSRHGARDHAYILRGLVFLPRVGLRTS